MPDPTNEQIQELACPTCAAPPGHQCSAFTPPYRNVPPHPARIGAYLRREEAAAHARRQDPLTREIDELAREVKEWLESRKSVDDAATFGFNPALWREAKRRGLEEAHKRYLQEAVKVDQELQEARGVITKLTNELHPLRAFVEAVVEDGRDSKITLQLARFLIDRPDTAF